VTEAGFPIHTLAALKAALERKDILAAVGRAFILHAEGKVVSPAPGQLLFDRPPGDCHIKYGYMKGGRSFVIKIATGFYENPKKGLPVNNGLVLVFDAETGKTTALLQDEGWLTSWRTAAAGALAAKAGAPATVKRIGIVGAGHQAALQARWVSAELGCDGITIWGRSRSAAERLAAGLRAEGLDASTAETVEALLDACNVVITCTPSNAPLFPAAAVQPGTHIVALGADSPGKQELDPALFARAAVIVTDDRHQCRDHGDFGHATRAGIVDACSDVSLGKVLAGEAPGRFSDDDITIVDLTGLPALDVAIATLAVEKLSASVKTDR